MPKKKQEEKRERILEAAAGVFARQGFYNSKVEDVASEAGVAHGTVYLYFQSKDDLLISVFRENLRKLIEYVRSEVQKESNAEDKLKRLISLQIELIETNPALTELMLVEFPQTGRFLNSDAIDEVAAYIDMVADILKEGISEKVFDGSMNMDIAATVIYSGIQGIATRWILEGMKYPLKELSGEIATMFLSGIRKEV